MVVLVEADVIHKDNTGDGRVVGGWFSFFSSVRIETEPATMQIAFAEEVAASRSRGQPAFTVLPLKNSEVAWHTRSLGAYCPVAHPRRRLEAEAEAEPSGLPGCSSGRTHATRVLSRRTRRPRTARQQVSVSIEPTRRAASVAS